MKGSECRTDTVSIVERDLKNWFPHVKYCCKISVQDLPNVFRNILRANIFNICSSSLQHIHTYPLCTPLVTFPNILALL